MKLQKPLDGVNRLEAFAGADRMSGSAWSRLGDEELDQVFTHPFYFQAPAGQVPDLSLFQHGSLVVVVFALHTKSSLAWLPWTEQWGFPLPVILLGAHSIRASRSTFLVKSFSVESWGE